MGWDFAPEYAESWRVRMGLGTSEYKESGKVSGESLLFQNTRLFGNESVTLRIMELTYEK
jgi:hypothetical protein